MNHFFTPHTYSMAGSKEENDYSLKIDDVQLHDDGVYEYHVRFVLLM